MPDFRVEPSWRTSRKRKRLMRKLGPEGVIAVMDLWAYAATERTDGDLTGLTNDDIADEVGWEDDPDKLVGGLVDSGLLDGEPGRFQIHNWTMRQPWVTEQSERSAEARAKAHTRYHKEGKHEGQPHPLCPICQEGVPTTTAAVPRHAPADAVACSGSADACSAHAPNLPNLSSSKESSDRNLSIGDLTHQVSKWGARWKPGLAKQRKWALENTPFSQSEVDAAKQNCECTDGPWSLGFLIYKIRQAREGETPKTLRKLTKPPWTRQSKSTTPKQFGEMVDSRLKQMLDWAIPLPERLDECWGKAYGDHTRWCDIARRCANSRDGPRTVDAVLDRLNEPDPKNANTDEEHHASTA